jgi:sec-independent protein translocase protein TatB
MSVGPMEIIIVLALALLVFGPKRLPEMGRTLGRAAREFRKASDEVKGVLNLDLNSDDDAKGASSAAAVSAAAPLHTPGREPWRDETPAAKDPQAPGTGQSRADAVPGLAGFLGVAQAEPPAPEAAPAFASFLGAGAGATADAAPEARPDPAPKALDEPESPAVAGAG